MSDGDFQTLLDEVSTLRARAEVAEKALEMEKHVGEAMVRQWRYAKEERDQFKERAALCDELAAALRRLQDGRTMRCDEPCGVIWCRWCYARAALAKYDAQSAKEGK